MSPTIVSLIVAMLGYILSHFNLPYTENDLVQFVAGVMQVAGMGIAYYRRVRVPPTPGDIKQVTPLGTYK